MPDDSDAWLGATAAAALIGVTVERLRSDTRRRDGFPQPQPGPPKRWNRDALLAWRRAHPLPASGSAAGSAQDEPTGGTTVRVTTTPEVILRYAVELTEKRGGENLHARQARGLDELGYRLVPKLDDPTEYSEGMLGAHWARLRGASDDLPPEVRAEVGDVIAQFESLNFDPRVIGSTYWVALDTLRALIGLPMHCDDEETSDP